jgi:hypothetical protein
MTTTLVFVIMKHCHGISYNIRKRFTVLVLPLTQLHFILGGLVGSVFATGPKVRRFKPDEDDGFLRAVTIRNTLPSDGK